MSDPLPLLFFLFQVFIKGTAQGSGCWFSTDYLLEDTWVGFYANTSRANSTKAFATAPTSLGPWTSWAGIVEPPWDARAAAAVTSSPRMTSAWIASGNTWVNGIPMLPSYADVWQVCDLVCAS